MGVSTEQVMNELADHYVQCATLGQKVIRERWSCLRPETRNTFTALGYDDRGRRPEADGLTTEIESVEYAVGVLKEAANAKVPIKKEDEIPACLNGDEVLHETANLFYRPQWRDPELASLAAVAIVNQQTAGAFSFLYFMHPNDEGLKTTALSGVGRLVGGLAFGLGLPASIGFGLTYAASGNGIAASLCAAFAFMAVQFFRDLKDKPPTPAQLAYRGWCNLLCRNFHIGMGHGLHVKLEAMVREGTIVPSVLFDLCAILKAQRQ